MYVICTHIINKLAFFFGENTEHVNQEMKRNLDRFPDDFCSELNSYEFKNLTLQNARTKYNKKIYLHSFIYDRKT